MSLNRVILTGRLGKKPELRKTASGKSVTTIGVAVDDGFGESKKTYWVDCVVWDKTADFIERYGDKGSQVAVEGRLTIRDWTDKDGGKRKTTEIVVDRLELMGGRSGEGGGFGGGGGGGQRSEPRGPAPGMGGGSDEYTPADEDIPF